MNKPVPGRAGNIDGSQATCLTSSRGFSYHVYTAEDTVSYSTSQVSSLSSHTVADDLIDCEIYPVVVIQRP